MTIVETPKLSNPRMDPKDYTIRVANDDQAMKHAEACYEVVSWRKGMTFEEFCHIGEREKAEAGWAQNYGDICWVIVRRDDYDGEIYSSLETHRCKCFVKGKDQKDVKAGWYYDITAVVTPIKYRGQGYGTHLLRLLHYILTSPAFPSSSSQVLPSFPCVSWGEPPPSIPSELIPYIPRANGSILWSDVPIEFYGHCTMGLDGKGFQSKKEWNNRLVWKLLQVAETSFGEVEEEWQPIWQEDLESSIYDILSTSYRQRLESTDTSNHATFIQDPASPGTLTMVPVWGSFSRQPAWRTQPIPFGFRLRSKKGKKREEVIVMISLFNPWVTNKLAITFVHNVTPDLLSTMLRMLDKAVKDAGAPWTEGEIWGLDPQSDLVKAWVAEEGREAKADIRQGLKDHVLGVRWYDDEEVEIGDTQMWSWV
ncbi:hypothetical protein C343_06344 [Cryptococcus neoformans C23]|uniref:N-acetyltransferase domain-containing protein n=2 Tax=Cryptococcus neoformans TaxID=5207 RepID=A0A854Q5D6_CRYNE|nr:hypothetical protein CNAG_06139 [Cryptococcus neoformans var. grubii H99]AUB28502.1 hypothetical protein CKF44_06139 [Cryptococcus neoformans var. grubii]OWZ27174.1 hypothetical protein C347_06344 [Cryptococcus neoformans var. grubii AD2-60a]OWZ29072.1 hypothetical protein C353_06367 [Cryptococcus neoformans var. grubii AD1-83a]OWZ39136.1 hypothetical protein C343_06344 [Cryptococcus neoformans var. grubii C23]OXC81537.1 hypothetical protein C344_06248 [Cryptococcus neoformans var. grubii A|eukprot:XP_012053159.1 hypothetical protein CNAG_06139 [Cryptococcus neoformans var. grubii H99]